MWCAIETGEKRRVNFVAQEEQMKADETLDCVGLYCPMPIAQTAKKIKELKPGQVLEVLADDPGIKQDMPNWCKTTGNEFLGIEEEKGIYRVFVRKTS
jgi:TusA-related sulfurtransferase